MSYASKSGRARTSASSPSAFGVCDRCSLWYNFVDLQNQRDWRGAAILPLNIYVCRDCYDTPQEQLRAIVLPADPVPIINARIEAFLQDESNYRAVSLPLVTDPTTGIPIPSTTLLLAEDGQNMSTQVTGDPLGYDANAQPPLYGTVHYGVLLPVLSVSSNGTTIITVTCSAPHGLVTNDQIAAEGLAANQVDGFYSITVTTATAFTFQANQSILYNPLLLGTSRITTIRIGLPRGFVQVPQTGDGFYIPNLLPYLETEDGFVITTEAGMPLEIAP